MENENYQCLVTKKRMQTKTALLASIFALSMAATTAHAYFETQTFTGATSGGILTFEATSQFLTITIDNTSLFSGVITGAVFNVTQDITSASLFSFTDGNSND